LVGDKFTICQDGLPINVAITSNEAPSVGINIGPYMRMKKTTTKTILMKFKLKCPRFSRNYFPFLFVFVGVFFGKIKIK
jgi:hypothetical protein